MRVREEVRGEGGVWGPLVRLRVETGAGRGVWAFLAGLREEVGGEGGVWGPLVRLRGQVEAGRGVWALLVGRSRETGVVSLPVPVFLQRCLQLDGCQRGILAIKGLFRRLIPLGFVWEHPGGAPRKPLSCFYQNPAVNW